MKNFCSGMIFGGTIFKCWIYLPKRKSNLRPSGRLSDV